MLDGTMRVYLEAPAVVWEFKGCLQDTDANKQTLVDCFWEGLNLYQTSGRREVLWLNDTGELGVMGADLQKMLDDFVNENVIQHRFSGKMAFVQPSDTIGRVVVKLYIANALNSFREAKIEFPILTFDTKEEALRWLALPLNALVA